MKALAFTALILALYHVTEGGMTSSAKLCVADACSFYNSGAYADAHRRAVDSLRYSVGILHPAFAAARGVSS